MPDLWFYGILNFLKNVHGSSNFRKIQAIVLKLHTNTIYYIDQGILVSNFVKFDWSVQIFADFEFFAKIVSELFNSGKFQFIELKFWKFKHALILSDLWY